MANWGDWMKASHFTLTLQEIVIPFFSIALVMSLIPLFFFFKWNHVYQGTSCHFWHVGIHHRCFLLPPFCHFLLSSDLHCLLSGQLIWPLHGPSSCPGYFGWPYKLLAGSPSWDILRLSHCPAQKSSWFHYFPENEVGELTVQVIFKVISYVKIFLHMAYVLAKWYRCLPFTCPYFSVHMSFPPGSGWYPSSLCLPNPFLPQCFSLIARTLGTSLSFDPTQTLHLLSSHYSPF